MRSLKNKPQVNAPSITYPHGQIRDDNGTGNFGTPVNEYVYGDFHQFFSQLMADGGLTPNELPENEYDGFQLNQALDARIQGNTPWLTSGLVYGSGFTSPAGDSVESAFGYKKVHGILYITGRISNPGTVANDTLFLTLPVGYRVSKAVRLPMASAGTSNQLRLLLTNIGEVIVHEFGISNLTDTSWNFDVAVPLIRN